MSLDINHISITGNLGKDPKMELSQDGSFAYTDFSIAQYVGAKDRDGKSVPSWWNIRVKSRVTMENAGPTQAEEAAELKKGDKVVVEGRITGWMPEAELKKKDEDDKYYLKPVLHVEANSFQKVDNPKKGGRPDEMPPM